MSVEAMIADTWRAYVEKVLSKDPSIRDDLHRLAAYKAAFYIGAESYRTAMKILEAGDLDPKTLNAMRRRLDAGLKTFGASLQPLRRTH